MSRLSIKPGTKVNANIYFYDDHQVIILSGVTQIMCMFSDELFEITSNKGSIDLHCPGCGVKLSRVEG